MRLLVPLLLAALLAVPHAARADHVSYLDAQAAVSKAGRQRMLSQFMVKEYLQIAEGLDAGIARGHLAESIWVFDDQLSDLKRFAATPELQKAVGDVEQQWAAFRAVAAAPPNREGAAKLHAAGEQLLEAAERNTAALERHAGTPAGKLVNLSGRQRMLSQRIAKNYLLLAGRIHPPAAREELKTARDEFGRALGELRAAPQTSGEIRGELDAVAGLWQDLQPLLGRERTVGAERMKVIAITDAILARMERVTSLYGKL